MNGNIVVNINHANKQAYLKNIANTQENNMRRREEGVGLTKYNIESHVNYDDEDVFIFSGSGSSKVRVDEIIRKAIEHQKYQNNQQ